MTAARNRTSVRLGGNLARPRFQPAPIRLGYVPLNDAAPLIVAQEWGLFAKHGLKVRLSRELGWATVRDKLVHGELDGAHALCTLPVMLALGLGCVRTEVLTGLILNLHGNAITLSNELWNSGLRDASSLRAFLTANRGRRAFTFASVSACSTHTHLLRTWFQRAGAELDRDVRLIVVPPPQLVANLAAGHLDGFCVGEPWNSHAVAEGLAWVAATSAELAPYHPEKVLVVRGEFDAARHGEHVRLLAALLEACALCDAPERRSDICELLSRPGYLNLPVEVIRRGFAGRFECGRGQSVPSDELLVFHRDDANVPSSDKVGWIARHLFGGVQPKPPTFAQLTQIFRADLHAEAREILSTTQTQGIESESHLLAA